MIRSQGARTSDPYSELQLRPHATRDLIIEAYWIVVARVRNSGASHEDVRDRIFALNDAYALLMDERRRAEYDAARGFDTIQPTVVKLQPVDPRVPAIEHAVIADGSDYYRLLAIERWAEPAIIRAARRSMLRMASGNSVRDFCLRDLLTEVYETLSDPERRAEYDATLPRDRRGGHEAERETVTELAPIESPHVEAATMIQEISAPPEVDDEPRDPLDKLRHAGDGAPVEQERHGGLLGRLRGGGQQPTAETPQAAPPAPRPAPTPKPKKLNEQQRTIAAEQDRLLSLRDALLASDEEPEAPPPEPEPVPATASPRLIIWSDGGRAVPLGGDTLSIGSGPGRDIMLTGADVRSNHAQVWLHRDTLALRVPDGEDTLVNGSRMIMPLLFLDDGDEIRIGEHRLTFRGYADF